MFSISDKELKDLIDKHLGNPLPASNTPVYDLKPIVEYGILVLYAKLHSKDGRICVCGERLSLYKKHKCPVSIEKPKSSFLEIIDIQTLEKTSDTLRTHWTGCNLAILTPDFILQGYYKKDLLFQKKAPEACSLVASTDRICLGTFTGEVISIDPITQEETVKQCHEDTVTSIHNENGVILSTSLDGSIFYKKRMMIGSGVIDARRISEDRFVCACVDNTVVIWEFGEKKCFVGHKDRIKALTHDRFTITTSKNGQVGFFNNNGSDFRDMECSMHRRAGVNQFYGYGLGRVFQYDVTQECELWSTEERTLSLDVKNNLLVYSQGKAIKIKDTRTKEVMDIPINVKVTDLSISDLGDMILVCTEQQPRLLEIRSVL